MSNRLTQLLTLKGAYRPYFIIILSFMLYLIFYQPDDCHYYNRTCCSCNSTQAAVTAAAAAPQAQNPISGQVLLASVVEHYIRHSNSLSIQSKAIFEFLRRQQQELFSKCGDKGEEDIENILHDLAPLFKLTQRFGTPKQRQYRLLVDIGANVGRTSRCFINQITDYSCRNNDAGSSLGHQACIDQKNDAIIWAFEPIPATFAELVDRAQKLKWANYAQWIGFNAAVAEKDGQTFFYSNGGAGDEQASQDPKAAWSENRILTQVVSLDQLLMRDGLMTDRQRYGVALEGARNLFEYSRQLNVFAMKIDTEGYDYFVLLGAAESLKAKRVKFLTFEYHEKWFSNNRTFTLRDTAEMMLKLEYVCYWITSTRLIPLSGPWWVPEYEVRTWSNVLCGQLGDLDFHVLIDGHNARIWSQ